MAQGKTPCTQVHGAQDYSTSIADTKVDGNHACTSARPHPHEPAIRLEPNTYFYNLRSSNK